MDPFFTRNRMSDYLDDSMSPKDRAEFEESIAKHPELAEELKTLQATKDILNRHGTVDAPPDLFDSILDHVDNAGANTNHWISFAKYGLVAAAAALAVVVWSHQDTSPLSNDMVDAGGVVSTGDVLTKEVLKKPEIQSIPQPKESISETLKPQPQSEAKEAVVTTFEPPVDPTVHLKPDLEQKPEVKEESQLSKENNLAKHLHKVINEPNPQVDMVVDDESVGNRIDTMDPLFLKTIHKLQNDHKLKVLGPDEKPFQPYSMTEENNYQSLTLIAPKTEWDNLNKALQEHGANITERIGKKDKSLAHIEVYYQDLE